MKIHEFQAKELFREYNVSVPQGGVAFTPTEARKAAESLPGFPVVVKAQIHAGGRGKGGGVKLAQSIEEVESLADEILGMTLVTHQTGPEGRLVRKVLIEQGLDIAKELYLSILPDRATAQNVIMASEAGGMDIEAVAAETPEKIIKVFVNPLGGIQPYHVREVAFGLNIPPAAMKGFGQLLHLLYRLFATYDCSLVEINPLVLTADDQVIALDAKVDVDSNALYRHKDVQAYRDTDEEDPLEVEASKFDLNYIGLDGNIACMVNGAGLAMATMDLIKLHGGDPANFLDVGGGATKERVEEAFKLILSNENVKAILVNIFGGIVRCDLIAEGIIAAVREVGVEVPVVVRLEGTNVELGKQLLAESGLNIVSADGMADAAEKIVKAVKG